MEYSVKINVEGAYLKNPDLFIQVAGEELAKLLTESTTFVLGIVQRGTPIHIGALLNSEFKEVRGLGLSLHGVVATPNVYSSFIETGQPAHTPNFDELLTLVRLKLGLSGQVLYAVTNAIGNKIGRQGIKGRFMFQKGFKEGATKLPEMIKKTEEAIIRRLN